MAVIRFSPLIVGASGKAGDAVFAAWKGRSYVRKRVIPANPKSALQVAVREAMARLAPMWRGFTEYIHTAQNKYATGNRMSGWNWFTSQNRVHEEDYDTQHLTPPNPDAAPPLTITLTDQGAGTCKVDWTGGVVGATWYMVVWHRKVQASEEVALFTHDDDLNTLSSAGTFNLTLTASKDHRVVIAIRNPGHTDYSGSLSDEVTMGA